MSGISEKPSLKIVIGRLENGSEFVGLRGMILCEGLHYCTSIAIGQVREVGAHLKGRYRHPSIYRGAPKTI